MKKINISLLIKVLISVLSVNLLLSCASSFEDVETVFDEKVTENQEGYQLFSRITDQIFLDVQTAIDEHKAVLDSKMASIQNNPSAKAAFEQELVAYSQMSPEEASQNMTRIARTMGYIDAISYENAVIKIQLSLSNVRASYPNLSDAELVDLIAGNLGWNDTVGSLKSCGSIRDAELDAAKSAWRVNAAFCALGSLACLPAGAWAAGCFVACEAAVTDHFYRERTAINVRYLDCLGL